MVKRGVMLMLLALMAGCAEPDPAAGPAAVPPTASFLTDDLLQVTLDFPPETEAEVVRGLTDCAAAEAVLLRGAGFARHVRTTVTEEAGISRADAIYTVSLTLPRGTFSIDAEAVATSCREQGNTGV
jgi:hypothetical protein